MCSKIIGPRTCDEIAVNRLNLTALNCWLGHMCLGYKDWRFNAPNARNIFCCHFDYLIKRTNYLLIILLVSLHNRLHKLNVIYRIIRFFSANRSERRNSWSRIRCNWGTTFDINGSSDGAELVFLNQSFTLFPLRKVGFKYVHESQESQHWPVPQEG